MELDENMDTDRMDEDTIEDTMMELNYDSTESDDDSTESNDERIESDDESTGMDDKSLGSDDGSSESDNDGLPIPIELSYERLVFISILC
jgi:hypothetical protein